ncbi:MAG: hypothetical protein V3V03_05980 [Hyphomonadaceae bacterium]
MSDAQFQTFMAGGLVLLVASAVTIAWLMWRDREQRDQCATEMLGGVGHEYRLNLHQMLAELSILGAGESVGPSALLPITHPQMDGVNRSQIDANRRALAVIGASYQELGARKMELRSAISKGESIDDRLEEAIDAGIDGLATLYLWDEHCGAAPTEARPTRSWAVRDWMKRHGFGGFAFPGMHFRDEVVERLRQYGMDLAPKPLTHSAAEYYAMKYDRQADPRGVFGRRRIKEDDAKTAEELEDEIKEIEDELEGAAEDTASDVGDDLVDADEIADELEAAEEAADAIDAASVDENKTVEDISDSVVDEVSEELADLVDDIAKRAPAN